MRDIKNIQENLELFISCFNNRRCVILNRNNIDLNQLLLLKTAFETPEHRGWKDRHQASYENIFNTLKSENCKICKYFNGEQEKEDILKEIIQ